MNESSRSDMSENKLTDIPACIGSMTSLGRLDVHSNSIATLPEEIGCLKQVTCLKATSMQPVLAPLTLA
jgi:Leucine-rich repeat (LRR) protein